jgi:uncharacterized protein (UPF0261 family)
MPVVVLVGTLDTKSPELLYLRERIEAAGCEVLIVDCGVHSTSPEADISADEVARAAGEQRTALASAQQRGPAVMAMARGATEVVQRLHAEGRLDGIAGVGGSGGSSIISAAMQALPVGVPKLLVSTMASGDTRPYVGTSDIALLYSVVDIAGLNRLSERILANAAGAIAGMAQAAAGFRSTRATRPVVAATMYGVTTPCVETARSWLEDHGYEVLIFHATGSGGRAMEKLVRSGFVNAVLDVTTTELTDELVGGALTAGPERLEAAGTLGIPQVVSLGATEMATFGPPETVPARFGERLLYRHNDSITLMRISAEDAARLGTLLAGKLNAATGPVTVFIPALGLSALSTAGAVFHDAHADQALFAALEATLQAHVKLVRMETDINDPVFATAMAEQLHRSYRESVPEGPEARMPAC